MSSHDPTLGDVISNMSTGAGQGSWSVGTLHRESKVPRVRVLISSILVAVGMLGVVVPTMAQGAAVSVEIRAGSCDVPGRSVSSLTAVLRLENAPVGAPDAIPAASSFSSVPLALDVLTSTDHIVLVPSGDGDTALSCGAIGGPPTANGALIIGLEAKGHGGLTGIAYFAQNADPSVTDVSVFLAGRAMIATQAPAMSEQPAVAQAAPVAVPTAAPQAPQGLSADEQAYIDEVMPIVDTVSASLETTGELFQNPRFGQDDWTIQVVAQFVTWDLAYEQAGEITPPPAFANIHALFLEALRLLSSAGDDLILGLDTLDVALIEQGANKIVQAGELMTRAAAELEELRQERGL